MIQHKRLFPKNRKMKLSVSQKLCKQLCIVLGNSISSLIIFKVTENYNVLIPFYIFLRVCLGVFIQYEIL